MIANYELTEMIPVVPDFHDGPTAKMIRIPKQQSRELAVVSTGKQWEAVKSTQEPGHSLIAWPPVVVFLSSFAVWSWIAVWVSQNYNAILYQLVLWNR